MSSNNVSTADDFTLETSSFYTVLNQEDILYCSIKKPDEFLRSLLLRILKFSKSFLDSQRLGQQQQQQQTSDSPTTTPQKTLRSPQQRSLVDLTHAKAMYKSPEFKKLLNESKELQHLNLHALRTDKQRLSFFVNLHNLLSIHAHFYLASKCNSDSSPAPSPSPSSSLQSKEATASVVRDSAPLFRNKTEKLLFEQRMCYRVGQMGCVSLYDLKHHILTRRCLNKDTNLTNKIKIATSTVSSDAHTGEKATSQKASTPSKSKSKGGTKTTDSASSLAPPLAPAAARDMNEEELFKYSFYTLDLDAEPLWAPYLPSDEVRRPRRVY